jgi:hypothetical protein
VPVRVDRRRLDEVRLVHRAERASAIPRSAAARPLLFIRAESQ